MHLCLREEKARLRGHICPEMLPLPVPCRGRVGLLRTCSREGAQRRRPRNARVYRGYTAALCSAPDAVVDACHRIAASGERQELIT